MALPSAFSAALAQDAPAVDLWIEIEGLPYGFGFTSRAASWFSGRTARYQRLGVKPLLLAPPAGVEQEARPLDGDSSIGQLVAEIVDDDSGAVLDLVANGARRDKLLPMAVQTVWAANLARTAQDLVLPTSGSAAAGKLCWFRCTTAGASGANEPAWPSSLGLTVADGTAVWTNMGTQDVAADATFAQVSAIPYTGTALEADYPAAGGYFYVGRETFHYTSRNVAPNGGGYFLACARGYFEVVGRSTPLAHTAGDLLSPYPRFLSTRHAAVYATLDGTDANRVARFAGTVKRPIMLQGLTGVSIEIEDAGTEIKVHGLGMQRRAKLLAGIEAGDGTYSASSGEPAPTSQTLLFDPGSLTETDNWVTDNAHPIFFRCGQEYFCGRYDASLVALRFDAPTTYASDGRGLFSSQQAAHKPGDDVYEVLPLLRYDAAGPPERAGSALTQGDHPIDVVLQLLASRNGDAANGTYDTLEVGGAGVDQGRLDVAGIQSLRNLWLRGARDIRILEAPFRIKDLVAQILQAFGCYLVSLLNDLVTVRRLNPPMPGTLRAVTASAVLTVASWEQDPTRVVGRVIFYCDYDPANSQTQKAPYRQTFTAEFAGPGTEAEEFYAGVFATLELHADGQWTGANIQDGSPLFANTGTGAFEAARRCTEIVQDRYSKPFPMIAIECSYDYLDLEVGDLVAVTLDNLPDVTAGARGFAGTVCEVQRKTIDDARGRVALTLLQTGYGTRARYGAPAASCSGAATGSSIPVVASYYGSGSGTNDNASFVAGDAVEIWSADRTTLRGSGTVQSIPDATHIVLTAAAPAGIVSSDVVVPAAYGGQAAARTAKTAYAVGPVTPPAFANGDAAHVFAS